MKTIFLFISLLASTLSYGQTKKIAHKSHSGSMSTLHKGTALFGKTRSNLGLPGNEFFAIIDTVKAVGDKQIEIIYRNSKSCYSPFTDISVIEKGEFVRETKIIKDVEGVNKNSTKAELLKRGIFIDLYSRIINTPKDIVFIGFKEE